MKKSISCPILAKIPAHAKKRINESLALVAKLLSAKKPKQAKKAMEEAKSIMAFYKDVSVPVRIKYRKDVLFASNKKGFHIAQLANGYNVAGNGVRSWEKEYYRVKHWEKVA